MSGSPAAMYWPATQVMEQQEDPISSSQQSYPSTEVMVPLDDGCPSVGPKQQPADVAPAREAIPGPAANSAAAPASPEIILMLTQVMQSPTSTVDLNPPAESLHSPIIATQHHLPPQHHLSPAEHPSAPLADGARTRDAHVAHVPDVHSSPQRPAVSLPEASLMQMAADHPIHQHHSTSPAHSCHVSISESGCSSDAHRRAATSAPANKDRAVSPDTAHVLSESSSDFDSGDEDYEPTQHHQQASAAHAHVAPDVDVSSSDDDKPIWRGARKQAEQASRAAAVPPQQAGMQTVGVRPTPAARTNPRHAAPADTQDSDDSIPLAMIKKQPKHPQQLQGKEDRVPPKAGLAQTVARKQPATQQAKLAATPAQSARPRCNTSRKQPRKQQPEPPQPEGSDEQQPQQQQQQQHASDAPHAQSTGTGLPSAVPYDEQTAEYAESLMLDSYKHAAASFNHSGLVYEGGKHLRETILLQQHVLRTTLTLLRAEMGDVAPHIMAAFERACKILDTSLSRQYDMTGGLVEKIGEEWCAMMECLQPLHELVNVQLKRIVAKRARLQ